MVWSSQLLPFIYPISAMDSGYIYSWQNRMQWDAATRAMQQEAMMRWDATMVMVRHGGLKFFQVRYLKLNLQECEVLPKKNKKVRVFTLSHGKHGSGDWKKQRWSTEEVALTKPRYLPLSPFKLLHPQLPTSKIPHLTKIHIQNTSPGLFGLLKRHTYLGITF